MGVLNLDKLLKNSKREKAISVEMKINPGVKRVMIIGTGDCAKVLIGEIHREQRDRYKIVALIDDDIRKRNFNYKGYRVQGNRNDIGQFVEELRVDVIFFAIANIPSKERERIIELCNETKAKVKIVPPLMEIMDGDEDITVSGLRDVDLKDLLGRDEIVLDKEGIKEYLQGKTILVTGGGGSIGSELCRQIARFKPKKLLIFDIYENNAYDLQNELRRKFPNLKKRVIIGSVRDKSRLKEVFEAYHPEIIFHAAAHKHVPLMEDNPGEAIKNNVVGTLNVASCANRFGAEKFVLISTDKAVNPTNVMGATKRMCEMIIQAINSESKTEFVAVRFGNVLGSNGSVIPLFTQQIKEGGPVTVTHKDIIRYFMLIPEAAQLVLQAGAYAKGGEVFVLDMGQPVKIYDLAEKLIKLSGLKPHEDIDIKVTGLRPGEKLYEELLLNEGLRKTLHDKIFIDKPEAFVLKEVNKNIEELIFMAASGDREKLITKLRNVVPTFVAPEEINEKGIRS
ncbi:MAG: nucleoside-diphosphate sugar epimerase/dehydratase [Clostridium sp.]